MPYWKENLHFGAKKKYQRVQTIAVWEVKTVGMKTSWACHETLATGLETR